MSKYIILFLSAFLLSFGCIQRKQATAASVKDDPRWVPVDSLAENGLYASALEITQEILAKAHAENDWRTIFRGEMYSARFRHLTGTGPEELIQEMEQLLDTIGKGQLQETPLRQLLHSVLGEAYWTYYQQDRWRILDRTNVAGGGDSTDIATWDQQMFMQRVIHHYRASLEPFQVIRNIPAGRLGELLEWPYPSPRPEPADQPNHLGTFEDPLLIDILARRAITIFTNSETRLAEPAWRFQLDDTAFFHIYEPFTHHQLHHRDSLSHEFQALKIWQLWEQAHLSDDQPILLTDIMISRLSFVRRHSTLPGKDNLYYDALQQMSERVEQQPAWGEVMVALARWHAERGERYDRLQPGPYKWEKRTAVELCDRAIQRFPDSFGARNAAALKARLTVAAVDVQVENAVLADQPFIVALGHVNTARVWLRVVVDEEPLQGEQRWGEERLKWLLQREVVKQWQVDLPDDGDLHRHLVELPVEALPFGRYAILISTDEQMRPAEGRIAFSNFWSTNIAIAERSIENKLDLLLLDRRTGKALNGARAELYIQDHQRGQRNFTKKDETTTDAEGRARIDARENSISYRWQISLPNGDRYLSGTNWGWFGQRGESNDTLRVHLFSDRAIYRPGQEVFFKGIVTAQRGGTTVAKAGYSTTAKLFDANGQLKDSLELRSDDFGSFHGSFRAPGGLTGHMEVRTEHGSLSFLVEEYKRPTFEVVFDPMGTTAKLDEQAAIDGTAISYAGVPLDNAEVHWNVRRLARLPWWSRGGGHYIPHSGWGRPVEIASGTTTTNGEGRFALEFLAAAGDHLPLRADVIFTFIVEASVTDITGETQISNTSLSLGRKSIEVDFGIGEAIDRSTTDSLAITVKNLNGQPVSRPVNIRIHRLNAPALPLNERSWERPDTHVMTAEEHKTLFPFHPYADEGDPLNWPTDSLVLEKLQWNSEDGRIALEKIEDWVVGPYLIELHTTDLEGNEVDVRKHVTIYDHEIQNTGYLGKAFHVEQLEPADGDHLQPGEKVRFLASSALEEGRIGMEVERDGHITVARWFTLHREQQLIELPILEEDRGGFVVHFIAVANGREYRTTERVAVPWKNKELQVEWMSFRDKMLPGTAEEFRLKITGPGGDRVAAQLLATMYDASLDHFTPHHWSSFQWPQYHGTLQWERMEPFSVVQGDQFGHRQLPRDTTRTYPGLRTFGWPLGTGARENVMYMSMAGRSAEADQEAAPAPAQAELQAFEVKDEQPARKEPTNGSGSGEEAPEQVAQPVRSDFRETAFFFPDLLTDQDGSVILRFTMPEALTRWKLMGLAHTTDLKMVQFEREVITQKPLMVVPNLPRFLREGDRIDLVSKINVLEGGPINGTISLELFDPYTNEAVQDHFALSEPQSGFTAAPGANGSAQWSIRIPATMDLVGVRIIARSDRGVSDGEEHVLPILTDRLLVTESLPLPISTSGSKTFTLEKLKNNSSSTLRHQSLKLEFTPNPGWFAVQALPYLTEYPHECSEQVFSRFYANTLAAHIVEQRPGIKEVVQAWKASAEQGGADLLSALEKNPELKSILLEETPWVMRARDERERKANIALLFDMERMEREHAASLAKLRELQRPDGSWPWFNGMFPSRNITQHIIAGIGHLEKLGATDRNNDPEVKRMLNEAIRWMDQEADRAHKELLKRSDEATLEQHVPSYTDLQYLYARSFFLDRAYSAGAAQAAAFIQERISSEWLKYGLQEQAMIALALSRTEGNNSEVPMLILRSLKERATMHEELGMYWKNFSNGMHWASFPTETHALMVEAYHEIAGDEEAVRALRMYLLKLKQTTDWRTTKATANACYALLLTGEDILQATPAPQITVGGEAVDPGAQEAGTGYFSHTWSAEEIEPAMAEVTIKTSNDQLAWGALHWQYLEQMDKITPHESPFNIRKEVMLRRQTEQGPRLLTLAEAGTLAPGDRLTIRIELRTDRYVDHVHLKDLRAAGLEPVDVLSGHRWQGGLGYYQSIRDAGMHFFFDRIPPGTHVFEYDLHVSHAGDFSNGITSAMCMYAPEFSSHSAGQRLLIGQQ